MLVDGPGAKVTPDAVERSCRPDPQGRPPGPAARARRSPTRPNMAWSTAPPRSRRSASSRSARGLGFHMDGARFANAIVSTGASPADVTWRAGVDALSFGFVKNGGLNAEALILFGPSWPTRSRSAASAPATCCPRAGCSPRRSWRCSRTTCGSTMPAPPMPPRRRSPRPRPDRLVYPVEANELFLRVSADEAAQLRAQGFDFYDWGAGRNPAGHQLGPAGRGGRRARRGDRRAVSRSAAADLARSSSPSSSSPRSGARPGSSSATSSAPCRRNGRSPIASSSPPRRWRWSRGGRAQSLRLGRGAARRRGGPRVHAVLRQLQRRLSRRASHHLRPGRDGVRAAGDPQQPARLGLPRPAPEPALRAGARWSRSPASPCCSSTSCGEHPARADAILLGIGLTLVGMLGASAANVFQARERCGASRCSPCSPGRWRSGR